MNKKYILAALVSILLLIIASTILLKTKPTSQPFNGSLIAPPVPAADFTLTDQNGQQASLSDFQGKYRLVFFGFTSCTNECPATMAVLSQVRKGLGDQADLTRIVFISTDPARDSPFTVKAFIDRFDSTSIGFTGSLSDLEPVWSNYGVIVLDGGETHSTRVYLIDPEGDWRLTYTSVSNPDDIIADIESLIKGQ